MDVRKLTKGGLEFFGHAAYKHDLFEAMNVLASSDEKEVFGVFRDWLNVNELHDEWNAWLVKD